MSSETNRSSSSPFLVAIASWIFPGGGYFLMGQRARGLIICLSVLFLFFFGLLVGGVRCLEVPGFDSHGSKLLLTETVEKTRSGNVDRITLKPQTPGESDDNWIIYKRPTNEIRSKPWTIVQIMVGPIDVACDWWSLHISPGAVASSTPVLIPKSHSRVNELGVLYTAVAGMLNLLAIIDASHRAAYHEEA